MAAKILFNLTFEAYQAGTHDEFHFEMWSKNSTYLKPLYMVWYDVLKS